MSAVAWLLIVVVFGHCSAGWPVSQAASPWGWRDRDLAQAMRSLVTGSAIRGLPVVTISGGEDVAEVRDVVYSPEAGRVVGLTLNKRGFLARRRRELLSARRSTRSALTR